MNYQRREHSECDGDGTSLSSHAPVAITRESGSSFVNHSTKGPREPVECRMRTKENDEDDNLSDQSSACSGQGASSSSMLRAARADALSSSLVETMIEAGRQYESSSRRMMERSTMIQQSGDSGSDSASGQGECMMGNISNDSSGQTSSNGAAMVTGGGTSTTSSEEYRYTVSGSGQRNKQSPEDRFPRHHHHHHHHSSRQTDQSHRSRAAFGVQFPAGMDMEGTNPSSATSHGAAIVAHPSSPRIFSSESSSFFSSSSERGNSGADAAAVANRGSSPLVAPHREPGLHTIRRTMKKVAPTDNDDEGDDEPHSKKKSAHRRSKKSSKESHEHEPVLKKMAALSTSPRQSWRFATNDQGSDNDSCRDTISGSGGSSGTEGGYAGSASSNEQMAEGSCSSPSVSSDDNQGRLQSRTSDCLRRKMQPTSSNIADFSSGDSESLTFASRFASTASSPSSPSVSSDEQDDEFVLNNAKATRKRRRSEPWTNNGRQVERKETSVVPASDSLRRKSDVTWNVSPSKTTHHKSRELPAQRQQVCLRSLPSVEAATTVKPPILLVGSDIMAHVLTFLEPPEIHDVLSMPLSKEWRNTFSMSEELWRVLCLLEPFKAKVDDGDNMSDDSFDSDMEDSSSAFNRHRMMYSSFVRCMKYLARIKDDAVHGRPPSVRFSSGAGAARHIDIGENRSLKSFLAKARDVVHQASDNSSDSSSNSLAHANRRMRDAPIGVSDDGSSLESQKMSASGRKRKSGRKKTSEKKVKFGFSSLTSRLLGPASNGQAGANVELPWSCAIYSIVNWMVAFGEVEGIQVMCLKVLPFLLEDEQQRITAQRAGLTDIVLRDMVLFPESAPLNTAAFHTIVLLARPLGGREGMLFHSSMVNSSGIFNSGSQSGKNGIAVMLDSMRRFECDDVLQAMACWALVNVALAPSQKAMLVKLGGIEATANAMMQHPHSAEVQFRALFALINLVIPSVNLPDAAEERRLQEHLGEINDTSEKEMLDESVTQIANLVVVAMKNFCSSEAILNRACLVLHNLSLTQDYHTTLLWTPNCYQMLEWCLANYRTDQVLQQSAAGTLHRLQVTLSQDENLRTRFVAAIQAQQQQSLEQARHEARLLHEQQQLLHQRGAQPTS